MESIYVASNESRIANSEYKIGKHTGSFEQLFYDLKEELDAPIICLYIPLQMNEDYSDEVLKRVFTSLRYDRIGETDWVESEIFKINKVIGEEINNVESIMESEVGEINYSELARITNKMDTICMRNVSR